MSDILKGFQKTEVGVIPNDWEVKRLGKGINLLSGHHVLAQYCNTEGEGFPYLTGPADFPNGTILHSKFTMNPTTVCRNDDILVTVKGSGVGTIVLADAEYCISRQLMAISVTNWDNRYIYYYLLKDKSVLGTVAAGLIPGLSRNDILDKLIPIPPTKAEQTAIATALNDVDKLITELEKLIAKKRNIKQGAMQELLRPKEGWVVKKLEEVATLKARIGWQGLTTAEYRKSGDYFLITGTEFKNGFIDWENCFYVEEERYRQDKNIQVKECDILVTKDGTIGKVALIKSIPKPATLNSGVFVIRPVNNSFNPEYFYHLLLSEVFIKFLSQLSAGSTINHLYQKDFVSFQFLTPKTIKEQTRIAQILSDMDAEIDALEKKLEKYRMLKQGMMQNLLTGKIRLV